MATFTHAVNYERQGMVPGLVLPGRVWCLAWPGLVLPGRVWCKDEMINIGRRGHTKFVIMEEREYAQ